MKIFYLAKEDTVQYAPRPRHIRVTASFETRRWRLRLTTIMRRVKSVASFAGPVIVGLLVGIVAAIAISFATLLLI